MTEYVKIYIYVEKAAEFNGTIVLIIRPKMAWLCTIMQSRCDVDAACDIDVFYVYHLS